MLHCEKKDIAKFFTKTIGDCWIKWSSIIYLKIYILESQKLCQNYMYTFLAFEWINNQIMLYNWTTLPYSFKSH